MADLLATWNGNFELGVLPPPEKPTVIRRATFRISSPFFGEPVAYDGSYVCRFQFVRQASSFIAPSIVFDNVPCTIGVELTCGFWFHPAWVTGINSGGEWHTWDLQIIANYGSGFVEIGRLNAADQVDGWQLVVPNSFVPSQNTLALYLLGDGTTSTAAPFSTYWGYLDAVTLVEALDPVAVLLAERARKALLKTLQDNLPTELDAIDLERDDGLVLPDVTSWYGYKKLTSDPDEVECSVYPGEEGILFPRWETLDAGGHLGSRSGDIGSDTSMVIALTHANRGDQATGQILKASEMQDRSDRYGAAIVRILRDNSKLSVNDNDADVWVIPDRVVISEKDTAQASERIDRVDRVLVYCRIRQVETGVNENVSGGGTAPIATTEQV